jgi:ribonuclease VapC
VIALDTSAIVAIAMAEAEAPLFARLIGTERCLIGGPTALESHMVLSGIPRRRGLDVFDKIMSARRLRIVPFDRRLFGHARAAFERFGRGRHRARLNFGDCMAYAVARAYDVPLLFKGNDFRQTDIPSAIP